MTLKPKTPLTRYNDYVPSDQDVGADHENEQSQYEDSFHEDSPEVNFIETVPSPSFSPTHTTINITITPCPPPVSSQPPISTPLPPPNFTKTTTTTTNEPLVYVNASDTGAQTFGSETPVTSKTISPPRTEDSDIVLGRYDVEFDTFHQNPFSIHRESDGDAVVTQKHLEALNDKLDSLLTTSQASSNQAYPEAALRGFFDAFLKEHAAILEKENKAVEDSTNSCQQATEKVKELITDSHLFLESLQATAGANASTMNATIVSLTASLQTEKDHFENIRKGIQADNAELQSSINSRLDKHQAELAMENKIMDELAVKTTQLKSQSLKLSQAHKEIDELNYKRTIVKCCVGDVSAMLSKLLEVHDSVLTIIIRGHLAEKLHPGISLLNRIEGVSEAGVPRKQGGETTQEPPTTETTQDQQKLKVSNKQPKANVASGSKSKEPRWKVMKKKAMLTN